MIPIKMLSFLEQLNDTYLCLHNTLLVINDPNVKSKLLGRMVAGNDTLVEEMLRKQGFHENPKAFKTANDFFTKGMEELNRKKLDNYSPILLNQNLVMLCTVLEIFFIHILEVIIESSPKTLIGLSKEKAISLESVIELKNYDALIRDFKDKTFDHFSRQSIKEQFGIYKKIGIDITTIFDYSTFTPSAQKEMVGNDIEKLIQIFETRHSIVHDNTLPIKQEEELYKILNFFNKVVINLSSVVMKKYTIPLDAQEFMKSAQNGK